MPNSTPLYDLTLLLSKTGEDADREKILSEVESAISAAGGSIERQDNWGTRPLTFRIRHESEAEYHLIQFTGPTSLLESLSHSLGIADGVLRFRIIKVIPGTPPAPDSPPPVLAAAAASSAPGPGASAAAADEDE
jgi:small subunit ribosomal protein S6